MKKKQGKRFLIIGILVIVTGAAMAYARQRSSLPAYTPAPVQNPGQQGILNLSGTLTQDKVLYGSEGIVGLSLTLRADEIPNAQEQGTRHVDMVIVLDRSGSMTGEKIDYARRALLDLLSNLTERDRFALVTYSDGVRAESGLSPVTAAYRERMEAAVKRVEAGGGTNLGSGLQAGMELVRSSMKSGNLGRVVLISDGLANQGITDPETLGKMASGAVAGEFAVSTVGVGSDFNEQLMTSIADRGAGNYTYLENPHTFAAVFLKEFQSTRRVAAGSVEIRLPLADGISLVEAGGYPIEVREGVASFRPGDLLSGQTRKLFLSLKVPTHREGPLILEPVSACYLHEGERRTTALAAPFQLACVREKQKVWASIDREAWEGKVLHEDYNKLKEEVSRDIRSGEKDRALERIQTYYDEQQAVNAQVKSQAVEDNLKKDIGSLRSRVGETFSGSEQEVKSKQKHNAKSMQYEGYLGRRGKK
jgi:Ca-activated chloride channel family protein